MNYMKVLWIHNHKNEPIAFYLEIDENRYEVRKIEIYSNSKMFYISNKKVYGKIYFSYFPTPSVKEIMETSTEEDKFKACKITKEEFEEIWKKAEL